MKILYIITRAERGGGQVHVADLMAGFRESHRVDLAIGEEGYLTEKARKLGVGVHFVPHLRQPMAPLADAAAVAQFAGLLRKLNPDLVHAHTSKAGMVGRLAGAVTGTPVVFTAHTWSFAEGISARQRAICRPIERLCGRLSARIITVSEANRQCALRAGVGSEKQLTTIWNGVPDVAVRAAPARGTPVRVVMVARFAEQKDHALLLEAAAGLVRGGVRVPVEIHLVGSGPKLEATQALAAELGIAEHVFFPGDRDDVPAILGAAHLFVLSTKWEGLPLSIIEALRAGLPVVASDVGGVTELVKDGVTGLVVKAGSQKALAGALATLIHDPGMRATMGWNARKRYESCFSYEVMLERTGRVYAEVLGPPFAVPETRLFTASH